MSDPSTIDALPSPEQMRNYFAVEKSVRQTRRLRETSRAILTGNIAAAACLIETVLVILHSGWLDSGPSRDEYKLLALDGTIFGWLTLMVLSLRWMKRQRARSSVYVLDRREAAAQRVPAHPVQTRLLFICFFLFQGLVAVLWSIAFRHMTDSALVAALSISPLLGVGYFVYRFVLYGFWEDLLFAAAVALAWIPFLFRAWNLAPLCLATFPLVIVGTSCLHRRWVRWQESFSLPNAEAANEEERS
ncbi:hypothetical protein KIH39_07540 [Telmatocola sphagniphila]|uniref:Uncharacterized protein n=1 Tax=Telmatocola sphagniphila TaxID=1123043 RepID=A0A8E6B7W0_9BACT|nr:hypothetical protein [Telmatocola sphagniphila]QVL33750.1 hypothetical protein KIH39_07540 [Telmatocola sphagniphila]